MTAAPGSATMSTRGGPARPLRARTAVRSRSLAFALASLVLFAAAAGVAHRIRVGAAAPYDVAFVPGAGALRWASLGHPLLAANLWWLRAVQYMGEERGDERGWDKLYPLVDTITDLDPRHGYAYQTTANILSGVDRVAESNRLLEKGTRNVPDRYILPFQRAVNAFLYEGDYAEAGRWFEVASRTPGAPARLRDYVVSMYVKGDVADAALGFLEHLEREAQDDESRRAIRAQMKRAVYERDAERIEDAARAWNLAYGVRPVVPASLVVEGFLRELPDDPFGGEYYFDAEGRVRSTVFGQRFERPLTTAGRREVLGNLRAGVDRALEMNR